MAKPVIPGDHLARGAQIFIVLDCAAFGKRGRDQVSHAERERRRDGRERCVGRAHQPERDRQCCGDHRGEADRQRRCDARTGRLCEREDIDRERELIVG